MKKSLGYLKVIISLALLGGLGWIMRDKLAAIGDIITAADKSLVVSSIALIIAGMLLQSYRLKFLLYAQSIHLNIKDVICLTFIGQFFNNFMPTSIGGDVVKAYYASGGTERKLETFTSIATDRMVGVITIMLLALLATMISYRNIPNKAVAVIIFILFVAGVLFMSLIFSEKMAGVLLLLKRLFKKTAAKERLQRLYEAMNKYRHHKIPVFYALGLSIIAQLIYFFMVYLLAESISSNVSFMFLLLTLPVISAISMLPSLNGLGIRESGFVYFLGGAMGRENAFALSLLYLGLALLVSAIGGVIFLLKREFKHSASPCTWK